MSRIVTLFLPLLLFLASGPATAQALPEGQGEEEYRLWLASSPGVRASVLSFEAWQEAAGVRGVLPTWQILRTASSWRNCAGPPFQVPPPNFWPDMVKTLRFIRDHVRPELGAVEAVSGYRNPDLNVCAGGSASSAHLDYFALDLVPTVPVQRIDLFRRLCALHARQGPAAGVGLGFYAFQRFHVDTKGFRRWGVSGPEANESPCAILERGGDPLAPPLPKPQEVASPPSVPPLSPTVAKGPVVQQR